ncbi:acetate--CoA ligase [Lutibacter sp. B1]|uniref:acetate--CoA ligase n=1 Tax=Lutibacter sp. B1 TaxID=2725996 RepID=UPI0014570AF1|nr:acetate--CoA ligase [Lutibacter sp. B1]NLP57480.1 acetate--CoA ligase [Lutibacter sp. B1]
MSYQKHYNYSIENPEQFWGEQANEIKWFKQPTTILSKDENGFDRWFDDGKLNVCYLAVDKHIEDGYGSQTALIYDSPVTQRKVTYSYNEVKSEVERLAGGLRDLGVKKGDTVIIYMPMIPHAAFSMLACARIGAIHSVVFGGFAPHELAIRIDDCKPKVIITATSGVEFDRLIPYKPLVDEAVEKATHKPDKVIVFQRRLGAILTKTHRFVDYKKLVEKSEPADCVEVESNHPLYILYTSGTTGRPKGILRDSGGYATALKYSMKNIYGVEEGDTYWAASDVGWVVGHSYIVYGPLINRNTTVIFEGKPIKTPDAGTFWRIISEYKVNVMFTAPTAIRAIKKEDPDGELMEGYDLSCLKYQFLAGERCDVATLKWLEEKLQIPVIDHWWQTESGWPMLSNMMGVEALPVKPGSAAKPVSGYNIQILNREGKVLGPNEEGFVVIKLPLPPGNLLNIWGNTDRFVEGYLKRYDGYYFSGDGGYVDDDGYFYITGRVDDVINVAGHRLSTAEMEEVVSSNPSVAECAVFGIEDQLKGQVPLALVVLKSGDYVSSFELEYNIKQEIRKVIGAVASLKKVLIVKRLPKTRSGKILRKLLRNIADGVEYTVPSTIDDSEIITEIEHEFKLHKIGTFEFVTEEEKETLDDLQVDSFIKYYKSYQHSVNDPEGFWAQIANTFTWRRKWDKIVEYDWETPKFEWFKGAKLNITENCIDRHLEKKGDDLAIIWEPNDPNEANRTLTYNELHTEVNKFANVLKNNGVVKGDRVCIYMPMVPELAIAVLACARIGAVHSVVFAGFSSVALSTRINDAECKVLLTTDGVYRGAKPIDLKAIADEALETCPTIETSIILNRINADVTMKEGRDIWWHDELEKVDATCKAVEMDAEDMLFILYTSGSTGKPKGMVHTCAGYMVHTAYSFKNVFQYQHGDVYFCTADIGWITGHSYIVYGPLAAGATTLMFEGVPSYPDYGRFWQIVEKYKVNQFYTAPTAIRALAAQPNELIERNDLSSIKVLGTVGEPINEEAWHWYNEKIGEQKSPIVDTWWQTETGGIMISPLAGVTPTKPTFATRPLPGIQPCLVDEKGEELNTNPAEGRLCIKYPWPSMARTIYGDHKRYKNTYFSAFSGKYFTGDGSFRDLEGNYRITGRVDDVVIVSGHNLGTAPIENVINEHSNVVESAIVGYPHNIKGNALYAYVIVYETPENEDFLRNEINELIGRTIGPIAKLDKIQFVPGLPKTRSGKIMRRILRKIAENETSNLGDISTLLNPEVVEAIKEGSLVK